MPPWIEHHHGSFRIRDRKDGKLSIISPTFPDRAAAESWLSRHGPADDQHLTTLLDRWSVSVGQTPHAKESAHRCAAFFLRHGWTHLTDLTPARLSEVQATACRRDLQVLLTVLRWTHRIHGTAVDPRLLSWKLPAPKPKPLPVLLSEDQVAAIRRAALGYGPRAFAVVDYLLTYAARPITACRLRRSNLRRDPTRKAWLLSIEDAKHSGGWTHPVRREDAARWLRLDHPDDALFPHYLQDRPWKINDRGMAQELGDWYKGTVAKRANLPPELKTIYHLKRVAITTMLTNRLDPATVALFSGHRCQDQVLRYSRSNLDKASAVLDLLGTKGSNETRK